MRHRWLITTVTVDLTGSLWTIRLQSGCNHSRLRPPCGGQLLAPFVRANNDGDDVERGSCHSVCVRRGPASARSAIETVGLQRITRTAQQR